MSWDVPQRLLDGTGPAEPITPEEWQVAVDGANAMLVAHRANQYGFTTGGPKVRVERCEDILRRGRALGYHPQRSVVELIARGYARPGEEDLMAELWLNVHDEVREDPLTPPPGNPRQASETA